MGAIKIAAHSWKLVSTWTNFQPSFLHCHNVTERFNKHFYSQNSPRLLDCLHYWGSVFGESEFPVVGSCIFTIIHGLTIHCNLANRETSPLLSTGGCRHNSSCSQFLTKGNLWNKNPHPDLALRQTDLGWIMTVQQQIRKPRINYKL